MPTTNFTARENGAGQMAAFEPISNWADSGSLAKNYIVLALPILSSIAFARTRIDNATTRTLEVCAQLFEAEVTRFQRAAIRVGFKRLALA